jgi:hypothetical protein
LAQAERQVRDTTTDRESRLLSSLAFGSGATTTPLATRPASASASLFFRTTLSSLVRYADTFPDTTADAAGL